MKTAAILGPIYSASISAQADGSLGRRLIGAVNDGDAARTGQLVEQWRVPPGATAASIALMRHQATQWSPERFESVIGMLGGGGATIAEKSPVFLQMLFPLLSAIVFLGFITGLLFIDARMTGWRRLAQRFAAPTEPSNVNKHQDGGVGLIGLIQLRKLLRAAATNEGLYLAFPKFLSAGHAPLLIPWSELHIIDDRTIFGIRVVAMQVCEPKIGRIILRGGLAPEVAVRIGVTAHGS